MNFIDLFAGAGGLSSGFIRAGFKPIAHVESDVAACYTLKTRAAFYYLKESKKIDHYKKYLRGEITRSELYAEVPKNILDAVFNKRIGISNNKKLFKQIDQLIGNKKVDLIVGGPPCQAYSVIGRAVSKNNMQDDPRNFLYKGYGQFLKKYDPNIFVFENVLGLLSARSKRKSYLENMLACFEKLGYETKCKRVNASDFGVLQNRRRVIIIGWKKDFKFSYPEFKVEPQTFNVENIFSDLPFINAGEGTDKNGSYSKVNNDYLDKFEIRNGIEILTQHIARPHTDQDKEIYSIAVTKWNDSEERLSYRDLRADLISHKNTKDFTDRFKVVAANKKTSQTVLAHISKDGHYYIHPDIKQNRSLSVREAARLQSFPDDYYFEGERETRNRTSAFKQIGNAVPPLLANSIAKAIKNQLV